ncbi:protein SOB FIVE-LIKE 4-like [Bidens hawaiensis]|uniref:protein SOB FIVE-LIKE 4-like n=1 Tax=Bidens hawaiensis TaxID=980011 RepID=UPI00404B5486
MESSSKVHGDRTEECQSSESGWTMYIGSSMDDDDDNNNDDDNTGGGGDVKYGVTKDEDEDTDDSMTSDASSGPSHLHMQQDVKHNKGNSKCLSKKNKKAARKKKDGHDQESRKKDESFVNEKRGVITTVQSGNMAWFLGTRK